MGFFAWITEGVRKAIVRGVELAAADINAGEAEAEIVVRLPVFRESPRLEEPELPVNGSRRKARV